MMCMFQSVVDSSSTLVSNRENKSKINQCAEKYKTLNFKNSQLGTYEVQLRILKTIKKPKLEGIGKWKVKRSSIVSTIIHIKVNAIDYNYKQHKHLLMYHTYGPWFLDIIPVQESYWFIQQYYNMHGLANNGSLNQYTHIVYYYYYVKVKGITVLIFVTIPSIICWTSIWDTGLHFLVWIKKGIIPLHKNLLQSL